MTKTTAKTLYERDFNLWIKETITHLINQNFNQVDWDNLIEEVESLSRKDKRELKNRLRTLFEHALKRRYVSLPDCYRGWEVTIIRTQTELRDILEDSPSLRDFFLEIVAECYQDSLKTLRKEHNTFFPDDNPFPTDVDGLLNQDFDN
ncbi:MAG: hypothetical protein N5P05_001236 [Chroococcopsis gigantea SAG 12.99]|nr:hypothetical protein [Chroococcopsis gigantea SAG 12.99]